MATARIYVEGKDDEAFLSRLLVERGCEFHPCEGYERLRAKLGTFLKESDRDRVAVIVDADLDSANRWRSLRQRFTELQYQGLPEEISPDGLVFAQPRLPVLGVWIMPDNVKPGCLEDFVSALVPTSDALWKEAIRFVENLPERRFPSGDQSKAEMYTWLAIQREPGIRPGIALDKGILLKDSSTVSGIRSWLDRWLTHPSVLDQPARS